MKAIFALLAFLSFLGLARAQGDAPAQPPSILKAEGAIRSLVQQCTQDATMKQYLMALSDRFLLAYGRSQRLSDKFVRDEVTGGASLVPAGIDCAKVELRKNLEARELTVQPILGTSPPDPPADAASPPETPSQNGTTGSNR
jgi:hypothetical protein